MKPFKRKKELRVNRRIFVPEVRVIDENGKQLGILKTYDALRLAYDKGLDLIEIVPAARPPVCKITDYGKYKYEEKKKKQKSKTHVTKEIKFGLNIQDADKTVKAKQAEKFLINGDKVLVKIRFKGREIIYAKRGIEVLTSFSKLLDTVAIVEQSPRVEGRIATLLLAPGRMKDAKTED